MLREAGFHISAIGKIKKKAASGKRMAKRLLGAVTGPAGYNNNPYMPDNKSRKKNKCRDAADSCNFTPRLIRFV